MKKTFPALAALVALAALASCTNEEKDEPAVEDEALREYYYTANFEQTFGSIDPNHDWGFSSSSSQSRATEVTTTANYRRILAEDLSVASNYSLTTSGSDWDFNDLVIDVAIIPGSATYDDKALINIKALGGTLPIYLTYETAAGTEKRTDELHSIMGVSTGTMVNTGRATAAEQALTLEGNFTDNAKNPDYNKVGILITNNSRDYSLDANTGCAPSKICVETDFAWCREGIKITDPYPTFSAWVSDHLYTIDGTLLWYPNPSETAIDPSYVMQ